MVRCTLALLAGSIVSAAGAQEPAPEARNPNLYLYAKAVQHAIVQRWTRPDSVAEGQRCVLDIRQIPGGMVVEASVTADCEYDAVGQRSIQAAVLKAQPLPYAGFEDVFQPRLRLRFVAQNLAESP